MGLTVFWNKLPEEVLDIWTGICSDTGKVQAGMGLIQADWISQHGRGRLNRPVFGLNHSLIFIGFHWKIYKNSEIVK